MKIPSPAERRAMLNAVFGSHLSIAGSMVNALGEARRLGLDTVQVFTKNQQQWKAKPLDERAVSDWRTEIDRLGWACRTVSHASYLINLASRDDELWEKSVSLMREEIERCEQLGISCLVHHPGSHVNWTRDEGIGRIVEAYVRLLRSTAGYKTVMCLEGTVGAGSTLGGPFEDLAELRSRIVERAGETGRVAFCLDTCHLHAAGHDLSTRESAAEVLDRFDRLCGLGNVRVVHLNDSKGTLGSKLDRHEHIGEGWIGGGAAKHTGDGAFSAARLRRSGFVEFVNHPAFLSIPKILETPKTKNAQGVDMDVVNTERLRSLIDAPGPPPSKTRPTKAPPRGRPARERRSRP